jgi:hypothetical protein
MSHVDFVQNEERQILSELVSQVVIGRYWIPEYEPTSQAVLLSLVGTVPSSLVENFPPPRHNRAPTP